MAKNLIIVVLALLVAGFGYYFYVAPKQAATALPVQTVVDEKADDVVCAQVITPARNPETGEIREFATPCDVPSGWEPIENDIPTLDLNLE